MKIAIDGPAGAGKSTIAKKAAKELGFIYVDTGAMYRAMAVHMLRSRVDAGDEAGIENACGSADISIAYEDGAQHVYLNGDDVTGLLRTEAVGDMAARVSQVQKVRDRLVALQQKLASEQSVVMDGRDIGTVVLPDAELKIYLTASAHVRAMRRYLELKEKGTDPLPDPEAIEADIQERDFRDMNREHSPLRQAEDAYLLDSSELTIDEVAGRILALAKERTEA